MKNLIITLCLVVLFSSANAQGLTIKGKVMVPDSVKKWNLYLQGTSVDNPIPLKKSFEFTGIQTMKHVYNRVDTFKLKTGRSFRYYKPYMEIIIERDGIKTNDTIINDSLNTIRYLLKKIDEERYKIELYKYLILRSSINKNDKKSLSILEKLGFTTK